MSGVTIAEVSAMINAAIILAQLTLPLAVVLVIVGLLKNRETAATWSVVARSIQSSFWPTILRSDYSQSHEVRSGVAILSWVATASSILLIVVGISTPLGLADQLQLAEDQVVSSKYAPDLGPMGLATPKSTTYEYSRLCYVGVPSNCPGVDGGYQTWENISKPGTLNEWANHYTTFNKSKHIVDLRIPHNVTEVFTSATANSTVSSIFDIQYRSFKHDSTAYEPAEDNEYPLQNNSLYTVGTMRTLQSLILNNKIELIEGLVVDTINGGIGFRNHTIPVQTEFGSVWHEDLLWVEPVTECVDTNLTIEFESLFHLTMDMPGEQSFLVDNGGIVNLSPDYPFIDQNDTQGDPQLHATAYRAAAFNNALTALLYNLTEGRENSGQAYLGAKYNLTRSGEPYMQRIPKLYGIDISELNGYYLPLPDVNNGTAYISSRDWSLVDVGTRRYGGLDVVNMSTVGIQVGMIMGSPYLTDGSNSLILEPVTNWTQTIITCASSTRASIKTVEFTTNGTNLEDVQVLQVSDKIYADEASMPLWAIERSNLSIKTYTPLWGLIDNKYENSELYQTRRKQHLWLPAGQASGSSMTSIYDSTPAGAHLLALSAAYDIGISSSPFLPDYSGTEDFGLYVRWESLSRSSETAGKIINLIWTDVMANLVVGTKPGQSSSDQTLDGPSYDRVIRPWKRHIVYDMRYAIPAIVLLVLWLCALLGALLLTFLSLISLSALSQLMNQLAPGRMAVNFLYGDVCRLDAPTKEWAAKAGSLIIGFERDGNKKANDDSVKPTTQHSWAKKTRGSIREDVLRMVGVDAKGDGEAVPVSVALKRRRENPSTPAQTPLKKSDPESSPFIQATPLSESVSVALKPRRENPTSIPARKPLKKSDPESSPFIQATRLSESAPGTKRQP
ncbi:hypothetical protein V493_06962 [Pseudogymnoascus sp. VKM F-4281 (FW-2241)]|nr:hypothetical protein V493_06962 [Pseudogymnoascus sp. VKM F-4281 (FW-2241)]